MGYFITKLVVEGSPSSTSIEGSSARVFTSVGGRPMGTVSPPVGASTKKNSVNIKIIQANLIKKPSGRPEFRPISQTFVDVTDSTANVMYLTHIVKEKWGSTYVLVVTSDGMRVEDSSGTQGK